MAFGFSPSFKRTGRRYGFPARLGSTRPIVSQKVLSKDDIAAIHGTEFDQVLARGFSRPSPKVSSTRILQRIFPYVQPANAEQEYYPTLKFSLTPKHLAF
ncbi:hypothetical protein DSO57_1014187 [Entomophthora muscae]|uniref:Uncharacterized protein n=1 Tax=Entomophthora muscae TaxID=34485 RepID=A0ACC2SIY1_9FUNG|nr:hypothetical protein DSO57_1014187 [Entomophthora muscae]